MFDHIPAMQPTMVRMRPMTQPDSTHTYERDSTPPPSAAEIILKMPPRRLPLSSLLKVRLKNVRRLLAVGDKSYLDGLIFISASALRKVFGDEGLAMPFRSMCIELGSKELLLLWAYVMSELV